MRMISRILVILLALSVQHLALGGESNAVARSIITPNPQVQDQIERTYQVLRRHWRNELSEKDTLNAMEKLAATAGSDIQGVVLQTLLYQRKFRSDEERDGACLMILNHFFDKAAKKDLIGAIIPLLATDDPTLKQGGAEALRGLLWVRGDGNFGELEGFLGPPDQVSPDLVGFMYKVSPVKALETIVRIHVRDPHERTRVLRTSQAIDSYLRVRPDASTHDRSRSRQEAVDSLSYLSQHRQWPVRLYAAEMLRRHRELRLPDIPSAIAERLRHDSHPLVRQGL